MPAANATYVASLPVGRLSIAAWFEPWLFDVLEQYHQFALSDLDRVLPRFADEAAAHIRKLVKGGQLKIEDGCVSKC